MSRSTWAVRLTLLSAALASFLALSPPVQAQEEQPFTNTTGDGIRVVPADVEGAAGTFAIRADGDGGNLSLPIQQQVIGANNNDATTLLHGRVAVSLDATSHLTAFGSMYSSYTGMGAADLIANTPKNTAWRSWALEDHDFHNWGDFALGARWHDAINPNLHWGVEGGALFLGGTGGFLTGGPDFGATSPFLRALVSFAPLDSNELMIHANLGGYYDQSFNIWKSAFTTGTSGIGGPTRTTAGSVNQIFPEERQMLGIYGDGPGGIPRLIGGAMASYEVNRFFKPFLELSFETTEGATSRITPGIAVSPAENTHLMVSVDLKLTQAGDAPIDPPVSVRAGLSYSFGGSGSHPGGGFGSTNSNPPPSKKTQMVEVMSDEGRGVANQRINVISLDGVSHPVGETDANGRKAISVHDGAGKIKSIEVPGYVVFMNAGEVGQPMDRAFRVIAVKRGNMTPVVIEFKDEKGADMPTGSVRVSLMLEGQTGDMKRPWTNQQADHFYHQEVPSTPNQPWKLVVVNPQSAVNNPYPIPLTSTGLNTANIPKRLYWDAATNSWSPDAPAVAVPTPTPKPEPESWPLQGLFDPDLHDLRQTNALNEVVSRLLKNPRPSATIIIDMKMGAGDPSFQEPLAEARADALVAWLKTKGILDTQFREKPQVNLNGDKEQVRILIENR